MGWKEGDGIGKDNKGRVEPITAIQRAERSGLGSNVITMSINAKQLMKSDILKKTQERFDKDL